ncbi:MAG: hypothetical protein U9R50_04525 [Campylobacterota bacterium]|nr:hypothetical protein [Campylobacterota bacterium]
MSISRGLAALILFLTTTLSANYLYKDEVIFLDWVTKEINTIGKELHNKTGINFYVLIIKEMPQNMGMLEYEKQIMKDLKKPAMILTLSQTDKEIDIMAEPESLYNLFEKSKVLNPTPNTGSILPILQNRSKDETEAQNVARAITSAYTEVASQIAASKSLELQSAPAAINYLYKDEVISLDYVKNEVNVIGKELHEKTGIGLYVHVIKELPKDMDIVTYEKEAIKVFEEPVILLAISEFDKQIDIIARPQSLYELFDKNQILSPMPNSGTILPILTMKAKKATTAEKFGAAIQNGYTDLAEQIATSKDIQLESVPGNANKLVFAVLRIFFYGFILYALYLFIKRKYIMRKRNNEGF